MSELKPCPFCGAKAIAKQMGHDWWKVMIKHEKNCVVEQPEDLDFQQEAIDAWNRRAPQPEVVWLEPVAKIEGGSLKWHIPDSSYGLQVRHLRGTEMLYTREQVEAMLSQQRGQA